MGPSPGGCNSTLQKTFFSISPLARWRVDIRNQHPHRLPPSSRLPRKPTSAPPPHYTDRLLVWCAAPKFSPKSMALWHMAHLAFPCASIAFASHVGYLPYGTHEPGIRSSMGPPPWAAFKVCHEANSQAQPQDAPLSALQTSTEGSKKPRQHDDGTHRVLLDICGEEGVRLQPRGKGPRVTLLITPPCWTQTRAKRRLIPGSMDGAWPSWSMESSISRRSLSKARSRQKIAKVGLTNAACLCPQASMGLVYATGQHRVRHSKALHSLLEIAVHQGAACGCVPLPPVCYHRRRQPPLPPCNRPFARSELRCGQ